MFANYDSQNNEQRCKQMREGAVEIANGAILGNGLTMSHFWVDASNLSALAAVRRLALVFAIGNADYTYRWGGVIPTSPTNTQGVLRFDIAVRHGVHNAKASFYFDVLKRHTLFKALAHVPRNGVGALILQASEPQSIDAMKRPDQMLLTFGGPRDMDFVRLLIDTYKRLGMP